MRAAHDRFAAALDVHDVGAAIAADEARAAARENWSTLGRLLDLDDDEPAADGQAPA
jgi:hypothetical protein